MSDRILAMMRREGTQIMFIIKYQLRIEYLAIYLRQDNNWKPPHVRANIIRCNKWLRTGRVAIAEATK